MRTSLGAFFNEVRSTLVAIVLIVPVFAFGTWDVQHRIADVSKLQAQLRDAQVWRGRFLRMQIDEESSVRGYVVTRDPSFLGPYAFGLVNIGPDVARLRATLERVDMPAAVALVDREQAINEAWLATYAHPLLREPVRNGVAIQIHGRRLVDHFRDLDQQLTALLDSSALAIDRRFARALRTQILLDVALLVLLALGGTMLAYFLSRSSRRAFEADVLYQNQKRIAESLQTAFLQKMLPEAPGVGLHATYVPAGSEAQVGGDWYDAFALPDGRLLFSIGDVAGHGIDAAVVMNRVRQAVVAAALHEDDPATVLERANEAIMLRDTRMVTAICGFIDAATCKVAYATAGHPPPVLATAEKNAVFLPHGGLPLGIVRTTYETFHETASAGSVIAFYTDGVIEYKRDIFEGERRLLEAVGAAVGRPDPAHAIHESIFRGASASDDVAIFTVTFGACEDANPEAKLDALQSRSITVGAPDDASPVLVH